MVAVDQLVEDEVPLRVVAEVGGGDELAEVAAVVVDVAGDPDFAVVGQVDDLVLAQGGDWFSSVAVPNVSIT